jgi:hypothetical protein
MFTSNDNNPLDLDNMNFEDDDQGLVDPLGDVGVGNADNNFFLNAL